MRSSQSKNGVGLLTARVSRALPYGRIIRDQANRLIDIIEAPDASPDVLDIRELNVGAYVVHTDVLYPTLAREEWAEPVIVHTGQHYDLNMSDAFFRHLRLPEPHIHLGAGSGSHAEQTGRVMIAYDKRSEERRVGKKCRSRWSPYH